MPKNIYNYTYNYIIMIIYFSFKGPPGNQGPPGAPGRVGNPVSYNGYHILLIKSNFVWRKSAHSSWCLVYSFDISSLLLL